MTRIPLRPCLSVGRRVVSARSAAHSDLALPALAVALVAPLPELAALVAAGFSPSLLEPLPVVFEVSAAAVDASLSLLLDSAFSDGSFSDESLSDPSLVAAPL